MEYQGRVRIGTAGWSYPDWEGIVYPPHKGKGFDPLTYLAEYFDVIELNTTFYRPPYRKMTTSWAKRTDHNPGFKFTAKLWRGFTHERGTATMKDVAAFKEGLEPLVEADKLGALLLQFPWSFKNDPENLRYLIKVMETFRQYPLALEVRHSSWDTAEIYQLLQERMVGFCNIDQPLFYRSLKPTSRVTSSVGYIRLHGQNYQDWFREDAGRDERYNYLYSMEELKPWADKIREIAEKSRDTFVITNNHYRGQAVCNALQLRNLYEGTKVKVPPPLLPTFPELEEVASDTPIQGTLL